MAVLPEEERDGQQAPVLRHHSDEDPGAGPGHRGPLHIPLQVRDGGGQQLLL